MIRTQAVINNTARWITGMGKRKRTEELMKACNWLTLKEMIDYYSTIALWKILWLDAPIYMKDRLKIDDQSLLSTSHPRLQNTKTSFRWRVISKWNSLPLETRHMRSLPRFKKAVKFWILAKREPDPGH